MSVDDWITDGLANGSGVRREAALLAKLFIEFVYSAVFSSVLFAPVVVGLQFTGRWHPVVLSVWVAILSLTFGKEMHCRWGPDD